MRKQGKNGGGLIMKKWDEKQKKKLKRYWKMALETQYEFQLKIDYVEFTMQDELGIDDLEFFHDDFGCMVGIGNQYAKKKDKYELLQGDDLL